MNELAIGWISIILGILGYLIGQFIYSWDMHKIRRCSARFPMFAARDRLVELVASGRMQEDDLAWKIAYAGTNIWLNPKRSHSFWTELSSYIRYEIRLEKDKRAAKNASRLQSAILERAREIPEFQDTILKIDHARRLLMRSQTHIWDRIAITILLSLGYLIRGILRILNFLLRPFDSSLGITAFKEGLKGKEKPRSAHIAVVRLRPRDVYRISNHTRQSQPDLETLAGGLIAWSGKLSPDRDRTVAAN